MTCGIDAAGYTCSAHYWSVGCSATHVLTSYDAHDYRRDAQPRVQGSAGTKKDAEYHMGFGDTPVSESVTAATTEVPVAANSASVSAVTHPAQEHAPTELPVVHSKSCAAAGADTSNHVAADTCVADDVAASAAAPGQGC